MGWTQSNIKDALHPCLLHRKTQVTAFELGAAIEAINTFSDILANTSADIYIDNTAADNIASQRRYQTSDLNHMVSQLADLTFLHNIHLRVFRVPSKSNPADLPSRDRPPPQLTRKIKRTHIPMPWTISPICGTSAQ